MQKLQEDNKSSCPNVAGDFAIQSLSAETFQHEITTRTTKKTVVVVKK